MMKYQMAFVDDGEKNTIHKYQIVKDKWAIHSNTLDKYWSIQFRSIKACQVP